MRLREKIKRLICRPPDFYIGGRDNPYLRRWWIIPRNRFFNIYLHNMLRDDDDRALHDHPYYNISIILKGGYIEHMPLSPSLYPYDHRVISKHRKRGDIVFRRPATAHRLALIKNAHYNGIWRRTIPCWSIFITGPRIREWGFWCISSFGFHWVHWKDFTDPNDPGATNPQYKKS